MKDRVIQTVRTYEAQNPIRVFDGTQEQDAREQAKGMRGSQEPFQECIEFGRMWAKIGLAFARQDYENARDIRKKLKELEESA